LRHFWLKVPLWLWYLICPLCLAALITIILHEMPFSQKLDWTPSIAIGAVLGVTAGIFVGRRRVRRERQKREILGSLPIEDRPIALRAAVRGPIPADPEIRRVARQIVDSSPWRRKASWGDVAWGILVCTILATDEPSWAFLTLIAAILAYKAFDAVILPRRLRQRSHALAE
jgi:hypothetical protein